MDTLKSYFLELPKNEQKSSLEAIIFASEEPLSNQTLFKVLILGETESKGFGNVFDFSSFKSEQTKQLSIEEEILSKYNFSLSYFDELIQEINLELSETNRPYYIVNVAGGYTFATRQEYGMLVHQLIKSKNKKRLSQASMETLAIIAYRQPVTKPEIEQIRGVNSGDVVNSLIAKNFVQIIGRKDALGKPLLYGTTLEFLKAFGLKSLEDLPKLKELEDFANIVDDSENNFEVIITTEQTEELRNFKPYIEEELIENE